MPEPRGQSPEVVFDEIWKKFRRGERHDSLRDLLPSVARRLTGRVGHPERLRLDDFWALREVSFRVGTGDVLGIIGRNGAGKSTTLKILTRILPPTRGFCSVRGRIGALIEVAAGFHQDLTGRENIFLQGAIMGMPKALIRRKFDEIVAFSGIEEFLETPVKRYSTGMSARLGFSIAAHLDPDVLIIDEVLAVGDFEFQQRAFDRVHTLATSGIPVVVVSHQLDRIAQLCNRTLYLDRGRVVFHGDTPTAIRMFLTEEEHDSDQPEDVAVRLDGISVTGPGAVTSGGEITVLVRGELAAGLATGAEVVGIVVRSLENGRELFAVTSEAAGIELPPGAFTVSTRLQMNLPAGLYGVGCRVLDRLSRRELVGGPAAHVQVTEGQPFRGSVQLNARLTLDGGAKGSAAGVERPRATVLNTVPEQRRPT